MESHLEEIKSYQSWARDRYPDMDSRKLIILEALKRANSRNASVACVNVSSATFYRWLENDPDFRDGVERAESLSQIELVGIVRNHAKSDWRAAMQLLQLRSKEDWGDPNQKLAAAREKVEQQKANSGLMEAQAKELGTRAERNIIEKEMWRKQFVTEERQTEVIQSLAAAVNRPLLTMTPEIFEGLIKGKNPEEQLQMLKGYLGREQSEIVKEVLYSMGDEDATDEENPDAEEGEEDEGEEEADGYDDESE